MSISQPRLQQFLILAVVIALSTMAVHGQSKTSSFGDTDLNITVSDADRSSAADALRDYKHPVYARTPAGTAARKNEAASRQSISASATAAAAIAGDDFTQNPGDVAYQGGPCNMLFRMPSI
jgi:FtsZ-interacting cell division protein ZipA